jgi:hypothetical protein
MISFPEVLKNENINERNMDFRNALFSLQKNAITQDNSIFLIRIYFSIKDRGIKKQILILLYDFEFPVLKVFFFDAYKKARDLGMKIYALRGLSKFMSESEIDGLMQKFIEILQKRPKSTPYNYIEYEYLKGQNALPYLVNKYNYSCFSEALKQVDKQYDVMPEVFKGIFTINYDGELISLRSHNETRLMMDEFYEKERKKYIK